MQDELGESLTADESAELVAAYIQVRVNSGDRGTKRTLKEQLSKANKDNPQLLENPFWMTTLLSASTLRSVVTVFSELGIHLTLLTSTGGIAGGGFGHIKDQGDGRLVTPRHKLLLHLYQCCIVNDLLSDPAAVKESIDINHSELTALELRYLLALVHGNLVMIKAPLVGVRVCFYDGTSIDLTRHQSTAPNMPAGSVVQPESCIMPQDMSLTVAAYLELANALSDTEYLATVQSIDFNNTAASPEQLRDLLRHFNAPSFTTKVKNLRLILSSRTRLTLESLITTDGLQLQPGNIPDDLSLCEGLALEKAFPGFDAPCITAFPLERQEQEEQFEILVRNLGLTRLRAWLT